MTMQDQNVAPWPPERSPLEKALTELSASRPQTIDDYIQVLGQARSLLVTAQRAEECAAGDREDAERAVERWRNRIAMQLGIESV